MSQEDRVSLGVGGMHSKQQAAPEPSHPASETVLDVGLNHPHPPSDDKVFDSTKRRRGPGDQNNAPMETDNGEFFPARRVARSDDVVINGQNSREVLLQQQQCLLKPITLKARDA
jgi:hypothetical protein